MNSRWVKTIINNKEEFLTNSQQGVHFVEWTIPSVSTVNNDFEYTGKDGVIPGVINFSPFSLSLKFYYHGTDMNDLNLFTQNLKRIVHTREPYYVIHSEMPHYKYAVNKAEIEWEVINHGDATFVINFNCYKGYAESRYETNMYQDTKEYWQFESGHTVDEIKYKHNTTSFSIFNGSSDRIMPFPNDHKLIISITIDAPKGFKLVNKTTGETFEYTKKIVKSEKLIIDGVHPSIKGARVGSNTNREWISLVQGYNDFEIIGEDISNPYIEFVFPFIYR